MDTNKYAQMYISVIRLYYFRYICHVLSVKSIWPDWMINFYLKSQKLQISVKLGSDSENFLHTDFWWQCKVIEQSQLLPLLVQKFRSSTNVKCFCDQHKKIRKTQWRQYFTYHHICSSDKLHSIRIGWSLNHLKSV